MFFIFHLCEDSCEVDDKNEFYYCSEKYPNTYEDVCNDAFTEEGGVDDDVIQHCC